MWVLCFSVLLGLQRFSLSLGAVVLCIVVGIAARSKRPGSQRLTLMRPPTTPEALPLAQGCPLGPKGEPSPLGCRREPALALRCLPEVTDSLPLSFDHPGAPEQPATEARLAP